MTAVDLKSFCTHTYSFFFSLSATQSELVLPLTQCLNFFLPHLSPRKDLMSACGTIVKVIPQRVFLNLNLDSFIATVIHQRCTAGQRYVALGLNEM